MQQSLLALLMASESFEQQMYTTRAHLPLSSLAVYKSLENRTYICAAFRLVLPESISASSLIGAN